MVGAMGQTRAEAVPIWQAAASVARFSPQAPRARPLSRSRAYSRSSRHLLTTAVSILLDVLVRKMDDVDHHRDEAHALMTLEHVRTTGQLLELAEIEFHTALRDAQQAGNPSVRSPATPGSHTSASTRSPAPDATAEPYRPASKPSPAPTRAGGCDATQGASGA